MDTALEQVIADVEALHMDVASWRKLCGVNGIRRDLRRYVG
jgi:hypothetical protein